MRTIAVLVLVGLAVLGIAPASFADHQDTTPGSGAIQAPPGANDDNSPATAPDNGKREMIGRVLAVDADRGMVLLGTDSGMVPLRVSAEDLAQLQPGDLVAVQISADEGQPPAASPKEDE
jgi:hypothetical protein